MTRSPNATEADSMIPSRSFLRETAALRDEASFDFVGPR